jgi:hypothetical protein
VNLSVTKDDWKKLNIADLRGQKRYNGMSWYQVIRDCRSGALRFVGADVVIGPVYNRNPGAFPNQYKFEGNGVKALKPVFAYLAFAKDKQDLLDLIAKHLKGP